MEEEEKEEEEDVVVELVLVDNCVSMSTLQIGQRLFVESHWSTHSTWNKCIQGSRRTSSSSSNSERQMVHFSRQSSLASSRFICGNVEE